jgi:hypothetical protein
LVDTDELIDEALAKFSEALDLGVKLLEGDSEVDDEYVSLETGAIKLANENCPTNEAAVGNDGVNNEDDELSFDEELDNKEETMS